MSEEDITIVKRGERCISIGIHRSYVGVNISVKTHPLVEEFMRGLGGESGTVDVRTHGRHWTAVENGKDLLTKPLLAYSISTKPEIPTNPQTGYPTFSLDGLGSPLITSKEENGAYPIVNLSFLRLVGVSEGAGVTFGIKGVHELDRLKKLRDRIGTAAQAFYIQYLRPVDLSVTVSTQELQF